MSHRTKIGKQTSGEPIYLHYYLMDKQMCFFFCGLKPGFHIVVSVVSVVRKKFIGQIEFILSRTTSCICRLCCIEHLYGRLPYSCICPMNFFRTTDTTDTTIWKPGLKTQMNAILSRVIGMT